MGKRNEAISCSFSASPVVMNVIPTARKSLPRRHARRSIQLCCQFAAKRVKRTSSVVATVSMKMHNWGMLCHHNTLLHFKSIPFASRNFSGFVAKGLCAWESCSAKNCVILGHFLFSPCRLDSMMCVRVHGGMIARAFAPVKRAHDLKNRELYTCVPKTLDSFAVIWYTESINQVRIQCIMTTSKKAPGKAYRKGISLIDAVQQFGDDEKAEVWFVARRWPNGIQCVNCDSDAISPRKSRRQTRQYHCKTCNGNFHGQDWDYHARFQVASQQVGVGFLSLLN